MAWLLLVLGRLWMMLLEASDAVVPVTGIELVTYALRVRCSTN